MFPTSGFGRKRSPHWPPAPACAICAFVFLNPVPSATPFHPPQFKKVRNFSEGAVVADWIWQYSICSDITSDDFLHSCIFFLTQACRICGAKFSLSDGSTCICTFTCTVHSCRFGLVGPVPGPLSLRRASSSYLTAPRLPVLITGVQVFDQFGY